MITSKEQIIDYFKSGIKDNKNFKIGIEHENFFLILMIIPELITQKLKICFQVLLNLAGNQFMKKKIL